jgi:hypothetical protein
VGCGIPQFGQVAASVLTGLPHSRQGCKAIWTDFLAGRDDPDSYCLAVLHCHADTENDSSVTWWDGRRRPAQSFSRRGAPTARLMACVPGSLSGKGRQLVRVVQRLLHLMRNLSHARADMVRNHLFPFGGDDLPAHRVAAGEGVIDRVERWIHVSAAVLVCEILDEVRSRRPWTSGFFVSTTSLVHQVVNGIAPA